MAVAKSQAAKRKASRARSLYRKRWRELYTLYSQMQLRAATDEETEMLGCIMGRISRGEDIREYFGTVPRRGAKPRHGNRDLRIGVLYAALLLSGNEDKAVRGIVAQEFNISPQRASAIHRKYHVTFAQLAERRAREKPSK